MKNLIILTSLLLIGSIKFIHYELKEYREYIERDIPRLFVQKVNVMITGTTTLTDIFEINIAKDNWNDEDIYNAKKWCIDHSSSEWRIHINDETCATGIRRRVDELASEKYQNITKVQFFILLLSKENGILNILLMLGLLFLLTLIMDLRTFKTTHPYDSSGQLKKNSSRSGMEFVRTILFSFVVFGHSYGITGNRSIEPLIMMSRAAPFAPIANGIFFVISGFFTSKSFSECASIFKIFQFLLSRTKNLLIPVGIFALFCVFFVGTIFSELSLNDYFASHETWDFLNKISLPFDTLVRHSYQVDKSPPTLPQTFQNHRQILLNYDIGVAPQFWVLKDLWFCYICFAIVCAIFQKLKINKHNVHRSLGVLAIWTIGTNQLGLQNLFCFSNFATGAGMYYNIPLCFDGWVVVTATSVILMAIFSPEPLNSTAFYSLVIPVLSYLLISFGHFSNVAKRLGSKIPRGLATHAFIWHFLIQRLILHGALSSKQYGLMIPRLAEHGMEVCQVVVKKHKPDFNTWQMMQEVVTAGSCSHQVALIHFVVSWISVILVSSIAGALCNWIQKNYSQMFLLILLFFQFFPNVAWPLLLSKQEQECVPLTMH